MVAMEWHKVQIVKETMADRQVYKHNYNNQITRLKKIIFKVISYINQSWIPIQACTI